MKTWDVFISHACEDKDAIAKPLATALEEKGLTVWFDEQALTLGDSLREKIDEGLRCSRFGVVILSHNFFAKTWPKRELDGLVVREDQGNKVVLPVWHNVSHDEVATYSPSLAGKLAVSTDLDHVEVANKICEVAMILPSKRRVTTTARRQLRPIASLLDSRKLRSRLTWFISVVLLCLTTYQVYLGLYFRKIGVPGLFEIEFSWDQNPNRDEGYEQLTDSQIPVLDFEQNNAGKEARGYFDLCTAGNGSACNSLAIRVGDGNGVLERDFRASVILYGKACLLNYALGCKNLARRYKLGKGVNRDIDKTIYYYAKSCELGFSKACRYLGQVYESGQAGPEKVRLAGSWYTEGCDQGDKYSCSKAFDR